jgi:hypothetical protein
VEQVADRIQIVQVYLVPLLPDKPEGSEDVDAKTTF